MSERLETPNRKTHWSNPVGFINIKHFTGRRSSLHQTLEKSVCLKIPPCPPFFASLGKHLFSAPFSSPTQFLGHPPISSRIHWNDLQSTHPALQDGKGPATLPLLIHVWVFLLAASAFEVTASLPGNFYSASPALCDGI